MTDNAKPPNPPPGQPPLPPADGAGAMTTQPQPQSQSLTEDNKPAPATDVVLLGPPTADGAGVHVLRAREQRLETGELRNLEEGRPITGEIVTLSPRKDNPRVCDVKESYAPPKTLAAMSKKAKGPAQVATQAYRDNWEEVFARRTRNDALN